MCIYVGLKNELHCGFAMPNINQNQIDNNNKTWNVYICHSWSLPNVYWKRISICVCVVLSFYCLNIIIIIIMVAVCPHSFVHCRLIICVDKCIYIVIQVKRMTMDNVTWLECVNAEFAAWCTANEGALR